MPGGTAVVEDGVGVVDDLVEDEALVVRARGKRRIAGLVADLELRGLGDGVDVSTPHETDSVANGSVGGEGDVTQDTLGRGDDDGVGDTVSASAARVVVAGAGGCRGRPGRWWGAEGSNTF